MPNEYKKLIRIYISDNCSQDRTADIIANYDKKILWDCESTTNSENIGAEKNIAQCYQYATSEYVWIFGDDDVILPGGLSLVVDALKNYKPDIAYLNNYGFEGSYLNAPKSGESARTLFYTDPIKFTKKINIGLTFISGLIIKKNLTNCCNLDEIIGGNLVALAWTLPSIKNGESFIFIERWIVAARANNTGGYRLAEVFGGNLKKITNKILWDKQRIATVIQNSSLIYLFPYYLYRNRFSSYPLIDEFMPDHLKSEFGDNWRYYIFIAPLLGLPKTLVKPYYFLIRCVRKTLGNYIL